MEEFENLIVEKLMSTERDGMKDLIAAMKNDGFFAAPCSGSNHLAKEGGLAEHSWNVLGIMQDMSFLLAEGWKFYRMKHRMPLSFVLCCMILERWEIMETKLCT